VYDTYCPARACEFPNDNPALHRGARWVCPRTLGAPRALWQAAPPSPATAQPVLEAALVAESLAAPLSSELLSSELLSSEPPAPLPSELPLELRSEPRDAVALALRLGGPLELDLARIVLPHRVADIPPPPEFIFRPFVSARRAANVELPPPAVLPLQLLGYRVVDARDARRRVQRGWRVDIAPCLPIESLPLPPVPAAEPAEVSLASAVFDTFDPVTPAPLLPASDAPPAPLPSKPLPSKKKQRGRAARVASSASVLAAALPGNDGLSRALSELDAEFTARRVEQPPASRKRRSRRNAPASRPTATKRAANAV
jgi:hypothetical protein